MFFNGTSEDAALSTSFRYPDRRFLWSRLELFEDRIEFSGFSWRGRYRRTLPLDELKSVQWRLGQDTVNIVLHRHEGRPIPLYVEAAGLWKHKVEARADRLVKATGPGQVRSSARASVS